MWGWVRMRLRVAFGVAVGALTVVGGPLSSSSRADDLPASFPSIARTPGAAVLIQNSGIAEVVVQVASAADIVSPAMEASVQASVPAPPPAPVPAPPPPKPLVPVLAPPPPKPPVPPAIASRTGTVVKLAGSPLSDSRHAADIDSGDRKAMLVKSIGPCLTGKAAWYGGKYLGRQTSSGTILDQVHATAAHRTLPLNSLVRVTNLSNGRMVIVRITDRGPVSTRLLIDMSPRAADELAMKTAGVVPVTVEQVVELPPNFK